MTSNIPIIIKISYKKLWKLNIILLSKSLSNNICDSCNQKFKFSDKEGGYNIDMWPCFLFTNILQKKE